MQEQIIQNTPSLRRQRGFTLIELAIVLAVLGIMMGGLFQLTASTSRTIQDQVTAQQIQQYVRAARAYLAGRMTVNGTVVPATVNIGNGVGADAPTVALAQNNTLDITTRVQDFRQGLAISAPRDANTRYEVHVRRLTDIVTGSGNEPLFAIVVAVDASVGGLYTRSQLGTIATLVGAEGASILNGATNGEGNNVATACNEAGITVRNAFAAACIDAASFPGIANNERPAALAYATPSDLVGGGSTWLSRVNVPGAPQMTTMSTDLTMGAAGAGTNDIIMTNATNNIIMNGGTISNTGGAAVTVADALSITGGVASTLTLSGGAISDSVANVLINDPLDIQAGFDINMRPNPATNSSGAVVFSFNGSTPSVGPGLAGAPAAPGVVVSSNLSVNGSLTAGSFVYSSDARLKTAIKPVPNALERLSHIRGVSFTFKEDGRKGMGIVAQEVEKQFPELVSLDGKGYEAVDYMGLTGPIIEAIRELAAENRELRERLQKLEHANVKANAKGGL